MNPVEVERLGEKIEGAALGETKRHVIILGGIVLTPKETGYRENIPPDNFQVASEHPLEKLFRRITKGAIGKVPHFDHTTVRVDIHPVCEEQSRLSPIRCCNCCSDLLERVPFEHIVAIQKSEVLSHRLGDTPVGRP